MKYLFILGRNPKLSIAEVFSYLEKEGINLNDYSVRGNALLVDVSESIEGGAIEVFGGVVAIGVILSSGGLREMLSELDSQELYMGSSNKLNYVVWDFADFGIEEVKEYLKKRFKNEKLKATEKKLSGKIKLQEGSEIENIASKLVDEQYFLFGEHEYSFGKIIQKCDYEELEKRDMKKPVRREKLSISPRLAKIMINLSQAEKRILDPFCGIGVVLQEGLLQELEVIGIDKDSKAVSGARENLGWFGFNKEKYKLHVDDSSKVRITSVDAIVTEPDLGETLKKIPTKEKARKQLVGYEKLMINVISNLKGKVSGRIVFTAPYIRTVKGRIGCNIERILEKTSLKLVKGFPIEEYRKNQIVGREIYVLE